METQQGHVISLGHLGDAVDAILSRALRLWSDPSSRVHVRSRHQDAVVGTLFLSSSTRTRVGFEAAAARLGARTISISEMRFDGKMSAAESMEDAIRVITGMVDALIVRAPFALDEPVLATATCPVINGGDARGHPTQALIDAAAIRAFAGHVDEQRIAVMGDLTMRASRSLLELFESTPPSELLLSAPDGRRGTLSPRLAARATWVDPRDVSDVDVVIMTGLAPGVDEEYIPDDVRRTYTLDQELLSRLPTGSIVLSPMPVIDEITDEARRDARLRMYEQSDLGVFVRMAVLDHVLSGKEVPVPQ